MEIGGVLFTEADIRSRVAALAEEVDEHYAGESCTVVSVLKGGCLFTADLIRRLTMPLYLSFAAVSSYRSGTTGGNPRIEFFPTDHEIRGRRVLVVDDILDTGRTLAFLRDVLVEAGVKEFKTCVLLDKPSRRITDFQADFRGFEVPDVFVAGYGLDYAGRYRNLPDIVGMRPGISPQ